MQEPSAVGAIDHRHEPMDQRAVELLERTQITRIIKRTLRRGHVENYDLGHTLPQVLALSNEINDVDYTDTSMEDVEMTSCESTTTENTNNCTCSPFTNYIEKMSPTRK